MYKKIKVYFKNKILRNKLLKQNKIINYCEFLNDKNKVAKVLIIDDKLPEFDKDSGSRRLNLIIELFLNNEVNVFLLADFKEYKFNNEYLEYYKKLGVIVYEPSLNMDNKLITKEVFLSTILKNIDLVWLHRPLIFNKYFDFVKINNDKVKIVFDMVDFHYIRMKREAEIKNNTKLLIEAKRFLDIEVNNCKKADKIIVISESDRQNLLPFYQEESKMVVIGNIHDIIENNPNFLDFNNRKDLLFVGSFEHLPNIDALIYLKNEIMPLVWEKDPEIKVVVIGSKPTLEVLNLNSTNFNVLGYVADLSPYFNSSRLFIAPLRYGAGIKGKIGQSMEFKLPLLTTDIGAEGFDFGDLKEYIVASDTNDFAQKISSIYYNENLWNKISNNSEKILKPFSSELLEKNIISLIPAS
jgi:glycosyltransferase involved in cell wall biosynthesis